MEEVKFGELHRTGINKPFVFCFFVFLLYQTDWCFPAGGKVQNREEAKIPLSVSVSRSLIRQAYGIKLKLVYSAILFFEQCPLFSFSALVMVVTSEIEPNKHLLKEVRWDKKKKSYCI